MEFTLTSTYLILTARWIVMSFIEVWKIVNGLKFGGGSVRLCEDV